MKAFSQNFVIPNREAVRNLLSVAGAQVVDGHPSRTRSF